MCSIDSFACRYPLLLNRLYKVTPYHHKDREALREAQLKIELHLEQINQVHFTHFQLNLFIFNRTYLTKCKYFRSYSNKSL